MTPERGSRSTHELAQQTVRSATELVEAELAHAKRELKQDVGEAAGSVVGLVTAGLLGLVGLELVVLAAAGASRKPTRVFTAGLIVLGAAGALAAAGIGLLPKKPLHRTARRVRRDVEAAKSAT